MIVGEEELDRGKTGRGGARPRQTPDGGPPIVARHARTGRRKTARLPPAGPVMGACPGHRRPDRGVEVSMSNPDARPISRFPVPDPMTLPDDIRDRILAVQEKSGFIPNVFLVLAHRPDEFRAFFAYHDALMEKPGNLTKAEREMIVVATSAANRCPYCVIAHGAILRIRAKDPLIADTIATNYRRAEISERQKAMLDFALEVSQRSHMIGEADFARLEAHGFTREDAWDIAAIAAFFGLSNRMADVTAMPPNPEFHTLGR